MVVIIHVSVGCGVDGATVELDVRLVVVVAGEYVFAVRRAVVSSNHFGFLVGFLFSKCLLFFPLYETSLR